jgi:hypothetical protein
VTTQDRQRAEQGFVDAASRLPVLWNLGEQWDRAVLKLEDPDADPAEVEAELDRLVGDITAKAYGVAVVLQSLDKLAEWQRAEGKRLSEKAKATESHAERLKAYVLQCMKTIGTDRIDTGTFTLAVRANPPHVDILNEPVLTRVEAYETMPEIPPEFVRLITLYKVSKRDVLDAVKRTGEIPQGIEVSRGERLDVR